MTLPFPCLNGTSFVVNIFEHAVQLINVAYQSYAWNWELSGLISIANITGTAKQLRNGSVN